MDTKNNKQSLASIIFFNIVPIISDIVILICIALASISYKLPHNSTAKILYTVTISAITNVVLGVTYFLKNKNKKNLGFTGIVNILSLFASALAVIVPIVGGFLIIFVFYVIYLITGNGV